ncbi:MAG: glycine cleavage system aminomethyltransferase GcvT [Verrucomicrobiota bacterium]|jgi:aminomethyltransferase
MLKRTPLYAAHKKLGARLVDFGGWEMPVQYTGILEEHRAVRTAAGLFDISHMGQIAVRGGGAPGFLNRVLTNDIRKLQVRQGQYTLMCNERGGVIDDLYVYQVQAEEFLLIVNASRIGADSAWLGRQLAAWPDRAAVDLKNLSEDFGALAAQGPRGAEFSDACFSPRADSSLAATLKKNGIARREFLGRPIYVSRTGYTGEDGFEMVAPAEVLHALWSKVLETGAPFGIKPAGLGARDTLRTEVCYPLYGHELDEATTPIEAGLGVFVAFGKGDFVGRPVLAEQKAAGTTKKLVAFKTAEKSAPPRAKYPIWSAGPDRRRIGHVTSGTQSPSLGVGIGLGYVPPEMSAANSPIEIEIRGKHSCATIVPKPIYRRA